MTNLKWFRGIVFSTSSFLLLGVLVILTYWLLPQTYFQQDEWRTFTEYLYSAGNNGYIDYALRAFKSSGHAHIVPASLARSYLQISLFQLDFAPYAIISILHHILNTFLLYFFVQLLLKNRFLSFITALLFATHSVGSQAVTWLAANINTESAVTSVLLSFIFFFLFVKNKHKKYLFISLLFILVGTLFKETAFVGLIVLPFFILIWGKDRFSLSKKIVPLVLLIVSFYLIMRVPFVFLSDEAYEKKPIKPWEKATVATYMYRGITYPLKIISQSVVPYPVISSISEKVILLGYPYQFVVSNNEANPYVRESIVFDLVSYAISLLMLSLGYIIYKFSSLNIQYKKSMFFSFIFVAANAIPYIFLPARPGFFSIYDSRSLYMPAIGTVLLEAIIIFAFVSLIIKRKRFIQALVLSFAIVISFYHAVLIHNDLQGHKKTAQVRKSILSQTFALFPHLPKKVIFYSESDKEYYGQTEKILPFQSGFGQTLLIWYTFYLKDFSSCFFEDNFLYPLEELGLYKECGGRGFGYFRDYERMLGVVKNDNFDLQNIYAVSWSSSEGLIYDISENIRNKIKNDIGSQR